MIPPTSHTRQRSAPLALVVDDDPTMRLLTRAALEQAGLLVEEAADGRQALARYQELAPDIVLLDGLMPQMDGFSTCVALRRLPHGEQMPILFVTELEDAESIARAYEVGATDFISKPWHALILGQRVWYMLRASQTAKALQDSQASLARAQRIAHLGSWQWDPHTGVFVVSEEVYRILGTPAEQFGHTYAAFLERVHPHDRERVDHVIQGTQTSQARQDVEYRLLRADGRERFVSTRVERIADPGGAPGRVVGTLLDITDRKQSEAQIQFLAYYDNLTLLPNRRLFQDRLTQSLAAATRYRETGAVLLINLDRFQRINETLGYGAGDRLLQQVAERLNQCVRRSDSVARHIEPEGDHTLSRFGGDQFTMLLTRLPSVENAAKVAERILVAFGGPFTLDGQQLSLTTSIGISLLPYDGEDIDTLLQHAEVALHHAKALGRNTYRFYTPSMNAATSERLTLENNLMRALEQEEFQLYFQPQLNVRTGQIFGAEALIRWRHPKKGMISPATFIPVAEEAGLITTIGEWVLRTACHHQKAWTAAGVGPLRVAVNLSALQFREPNLQDVVRSALQEAGVEPQHLELELTEGSVMQDADAAAATLRSLKAMGLYLAIDDFGTGYSSLSYLHRFPIDTIKIDRAFVKGLTPDSGEGAIVKAIIGMAQALNMRVLAEGVETEEQLAFLRAHNCDEIQGYLFSRPLPTDDFLALLQSHQAQGCTQVWRPRGRTDSVQSDTLKWSAK